MTSKNTKIWFPAKTYGWGWGPPTCWQGWAVIAGFIALLIAGSITLSPDKHLGAFIAYVAVLSGGLTLVCFLKGEKPGWRWGKK